MAIPGFSTFLRPVLELIAEHQNIKHARRNLRPLVKEKMAFSDAEAAERLGSGGSRLANRIGWAVTYLTKAKLVEFPTRGHAQITSQGVDFLKEHAGAIAVKDLDRFDSFKEFRSSKGQSTEERQQVEAPSEDQDPDDRIDSAVREIRATVVSELLDRLRQVDPTYFEQVVLDLLEKMGYGINEGKLIRTGGSGDYGIDGIIYLDRLGLDKIYLQAKRWKEGNTVGRPEIQSFYGALAGRRASKGVFLTTSRFTSEALTFSESVSLSLSIEPSQCVQNYGRPFQGPA